MSFDQDPNESVTMAASDLAQLVAERDALAAALQGALATIDDYLAYDHNGDPWTEDARTMGEMDINDYESDGRLEKARAALAAAGIGVKP